MRCIGGRAVKSHRIGKYIDAAALAICPRGHRSRRRIEQLDRGNPHIPDLWTIVKVGLSDDGRAVALILNLRADRNAEPFFGGVIQIFQLPRPCPRQCGARGGDIHGRRLGKGGGGGDRRGSEDEKRGHAPHDM